MVMRTSHRTNQLQRCIIATPKRCKDAEELKEKFVACSLNVAEYEHQSKAMDDAQKTFVVGENADGHQARVPDGTEDIQRNYGKVGDHHQRNGGR